MILPLDSPRWKELQHAYGSAEDIPELLHDAVMHPVSSRYDEEPWYSLWSTLAHQGSVYTASYAAVPHLAAIATSKIPRERFDFIMLAGFIEKDREGSDAAAVPADLYDDYFAAVTEIANLAHEQMQHSSVASELQTLFAVFAACRGSHILSEKIVLLDEIDATKNREPRT